MSTPSAPRLFTKTSWHSEDWDLMHTISVDAKGEEIRLALRARTRFSGTAPTITLGRLDLPPWITNVDVNEHGLTFHVASAPVSDRVSVHANEASMIAFAQRILPGSQRLQTFVLDQKITSRHRDLDEAHCEVVEVDIFPAPVTWTAFRGSRYGRPWIRMAGEAENEQAAAEQADRALAVFTALLDSMPARST